MGTSKELRILILDNVERNPNDWIFIGNYVQYNKLGLAIWLGNGVFFTSIHTHTDYLESPFLKLNIFDRYRVYKTFVNLYRKRIFESLKK